MTTQTDTTTFNARTVIADALREETERLWADVLEAAEQHGIDWTMLILRDNISIIALKRTTSRSTCIISNMLEDLKDMVNIRAFAALDKAADDDEDKMLNLKAAARAHRNAMM